VCDGELQTWPASKLGQGRGNREDGKGFRFPSLRGGLVVVSAIGCDHCGQVTEVAESSVENAQHKVVASVAQKKHVNGKVGK